MNEVLIVCKQSDKPIPEGRTFCSRSCATTYRNLLPEYRLKSSEICKQRNKSLEMREASRKSMKALRPKWETDPQIKELYKEARTRGAISMNKYLNSHKNDSEEFTTVYLTSKGVQYEREKFFEHDTTRDSQRRFLVGFYRCDFCLPEYNIDLEIDGSYHDYDFVKQHDRTRNNFFTCKGIKVYRIPFTGDFTQLESLLHSFVESLRGNISE